MNRLIVNYYFGENKIPIVNYNSGILSITYFVPSEKFRGLYVRHEYGSELTFNISESGDNISISFIGFDRLGRTMIDTLNTITFIGTRKTCTGRS